MPLIKRKRKFPIRVEDIMSVPPITVHRTASIEEAAKIMFDNKIGSVLVVNDEGVLEGIVTERDLVFAIASGKVGKGLPVFMIMTENPITVGPGTPVDEALRRMKEVNVRHLPVVGKDGKPIGMISLRDIVDVIATFISVLTS